jgi:hypothetical protein
MARAYAEPTRHFTLSEGLSLKRKATQRRLHLEYHCFIVIWSFLSHSCLLIGHSPRLFPLENFLRHATLLSMSPRNFFTFAIAVLVSISALSAHAADHPNTAGWKNLIATDFSNADGGDSWKWEDGQLVAKDHHAIWTKESYGNFILDLEFKVAKEANSGVFLRSGDIKKTLAALEIQVHESTDGGKYGMVGAIYDAKPPSKSVAKPAGEWNRFTITCKDSLITIVFNGEEVIRADLNDWPEAKKNPDGTPNKFPVALKDFARKGPIGFQGLHGKAQAPVWYRNVKIKVLE